MSDEVNMSYGGTNAMREGVSCEMICTWCRRLGKLATMVCEGCGQATHVVSHEDKELVHKKVNEIRDQFGLPHIIY